MRKQRISLPRIILTVAALTTGLGGATLLWLWGGSPGLSPLRWIIVILLSGVTLLALIGAVWRRHSANILLLLVTVLLPALVADQYFGRTAFLNPRIPVAMEQGVPFDPRWATDVALDDRSAGLSNTYPSITPPNFHSTLLPTPGGPVLPFGHVAHGRIALCNEDGSFHHVQADRHGFVNADAYWDLTEFQSVVIGDSFAEGWCVPAGRSFAALLDRDAGPVLNLGRGGMGALSQRAVLREYLTGLRAKYLVWTVFEGNDWEDLRIENQIPILQAYAAPDFSQNLKKRRDQVQAALTDFAENYLRAYGWKRLIPVGKWRAIFGEAQMNEMLHHWLNINPPSTMPSTTQPQQTQQGDSIDWTLLETAITDGITVGRNAQAKAIIVLLPSFDTYPEPSPQVVQRRERLKKLAQSQGALYVDGDQVFRAAMTDPRDAYPLRIWGHYTETGHALIAAAIKAAMDEKAP